MTNSLPTVTVDIQGNTNGGGQGAGSITYYGGSNQVKLTKEESPQGSGFVKLKHTSASVAPGGLFNVKEVKYGHTPASDIKPTNNEPIKSHSVWYHSGDKDHNKPLLVEIWEKGGTFKYHETKGGATSWNSHDNGSTSQLTGKELEQKLKNLNCQHYKSVNIDLTESHSKKLTEDILAGTTTTTTTTNYLPRTYRIVICA
ncbi:hypothetical protein BEWA_003660 [Theileria equi strain WA]|uniref:Uncharacterized protein n=1 Tax=Theileria equi strain WA TaxID=1537102 RepID=L0B0E7_THEEQ|nr:hypothetical protein BEWA_003660 [Theileria equi strain WA]AFZ80958.1 hypothetical protein BEWA_003660 [Theileria equi strain WA]|eukprot:XP_004830624.1 hypothetical protein BEWA_003660 [Theileria equi strain WA]